MQPLRSILTVFQVGALLISGCAVAQPPAFTSTRKVPIEDPFLHLEMERLVIPSNWSAAGTVLRGVGCGTQYPHDVFRASSPDELTGFQFMPPVIWYESDSPSAFTTFGVAYCKKLGKAEPSEIALNIAGTRPNARVVTVENDFDDAIFHHNVSAESAQLSAASNGPSSTSGREGRVVIAYTWNGHPEEELIIAQDRKQSFQVLNLGTNGMPSRGFSVLNQHVVNVIAIRAPRGQLAQAGDRMLQLIRSRQPNQQWLQSEQQYQQRVRDQVAQAFRKMMAANAAQFQAEENRFRQQSAATLENTRRTMARTQAQNDQLVRTGQDQIDFLAGNQYYLNPATGQTYTIGAYDGKTYMRDHGTGESSVVRTNDAYQQLTMPSEWVELKVIPH